MPLLQKKVCPLGDFAIGKTGLVRRYLSTIGVKVSRKSMLIENLG